MNKKFVCRILGIISIVALTLGSFAMAALEKPKFNFGKYNMRLGDTVRIAAMTNLDVSEFSKIKTSDPAVVAILDNGNLKAYNTGLSTLTYTFVNSEGKEETIKCHIEVSLNDSTYSEINGEEASKIKLTLQLGGYSTVLESPVAAIPDFPDVTKEGYVLEGWYKDANFTQKVGERERFAKDTTIYAKWITVEESNNVNISYSELYDDINDHWARNYIESVSYRGLFNGVEERVFGPEMTMTRAMVITVLGRLDNVEKTGRTTTFLDVPAGSYYEEYVAWGVENKIVSGTSESEFSPNKEITREEMAVMMANYVKYKKYDYKVNEIYFSDAEQISSWALESVKILNNLEIMQGNADGTYNPKKVATRAEIATVFYNYLNFINK